jgi:hypothetical protein
LAFLLAAVRLGRISLSPESVRFNRKVFRAMDDLDFALPKTGGAQAERSLGRWISWISLSLRIVIPTGAQRSGGTCCARQCLTKIDPRRVLLLDQCDFLFTAPPFDLLFSGDRMVDGTEALEPNQACTFVVGGKAGSTAFAMLFYPSRKVISDSAIEHTTAARDHIDKVGVIFATHETAIVSLEVNSRSLHCAALRSG